MRPVPLAVGLDGVGDAVEQERERLGRLGEEFGGPGWPRRHVEAAVHEKGMDQGDQPRRRRSQLQSAASGFGGRFCEIMTESCTGPVVGSAAMDEPGFQSQFQRDGEMMKGDMLFDIAGWRGNRAQEAPGVADQEMGLGISGIFLVMGPFLSLLGNGARQPWQRGALPGLQQCARERDRGYSEIWSLRGWCRDRRQGPDATYRSLIPAMMSSA